jgi:hypothetical protein
MSTTAKLLTNASTIATGLDMYRDGSAQSESGIATMASGIADNRFYSMRWSYGVGDNEVSGICSLGDMYKGRNHVDGSADGKFMAAMYRALADNFGIEGGMETADKQAFKRAFAVAAAGWADAPIEIVQASVKRKGKAVKIAAVQVPAELAFGMADADGAPNAMALDMMERVRGNLELQSLPVPDDEKLFEQVKALKVNCVGGSHPVFGKVPSATDIANKLTPIAIANGLMKDNGTKNKATNADKFRASLTYVIKCMDEVLSETSDESGYAPCPAAEDDLRKLAERVAAYFAA